MSLAPTDLGETVDIDVASTPAVVFWTSSDCHTEHLADVAVSIRHDAVNHSAFFKLRSAIMFKSSAPSKTAIFLFIHPERIQNLIIDEPSTSAFETASQTLGANAVALHFTLDRPADLIGPKIDSLAPKNSGSGKIIDLLHSLARATTFSIHIAQRVLSKPRLVSLCDAVSNHGMKSIPRQADMASLYSGKGGRLIHAARGAADPTDSPPSYDELTSCSLSPSSHDVGSKKRRRVDSDASGSHLDVLYVERVCRKLVEEQLGDLRRIRHEQSVTLQDELRKLESRIMEHVDRRFGELEVRQKDLESQIEYLRKETNDTIDVQIDDGFVGLRADLEDFVKEEIREAEENIIEHLENSASISLQFNT